MTDAVLLFAYEPVPELHGAVGVMIVEPELADRLIEESRAERIDAASNNESMRFVAGSPANLAAREVLRQARDAAPGARRRRPTADRVA